eukprot:1301014-Prymnesium_polylepis.1
MTYNRLCCGTADEDAARAAARGWLLSSRVSGWHAALQRFMRFLAGRAGAVVRSNVISNDAKNAVQRKKKG